MTYQGQIAETVLIRGHQGDQIDAYLARPLGAGPYGGVVVIHHMPGWDGAMKEIARRFAHEGFVAISPNLHFREGKATPEENSASIRAAGGMPDDRTMGDVQASIDYLRSLPCGGRARGAHGAPAHLPHRLHATRSGVMSVTLAVRSEPMWNSGLPAGVARWAQSSGLTSQSSGRRTSLETVDTSR